MIDDAWTVWAEAEPNSDAPQDKQDAWQAGYEAFECASMSARNAIREMPCRNFNDVADKLSWLLSNDGNSPNLAPYSSALRDLTAMLDRPTQDAFAVKLRAHQRAVQDRDAFDAAHKPAGGEGLNEEWRAYESIQSPLHSAAFDQGKADIHQTATHGGPAHNARVTFEPPKYNEDADA